VLAHPLPSIIIKAWCDGDSVEIAPELNGAGHFDQWHRTHNKARDDGGCLRTTLVRPLVGPSDKANA
jgi:hypothetical protein